MDPGRYVLQQGWDTNSALEGYGAAHEPNYRVGGSYDERRFLDERYSRENAYQRNSFRHDVVEREYYQPPPAGASWPQSRRKSYEEDYPLERDARRHEKQYTDSYHEMDAFHDREIDFRDSYRGVDNYRDRGFDRGSRFGGRDRDDFASGSYDYRPRVSQQSRGDSRERDYEYGRHGYDFDYDNRKEGRWRRRESHERERDKRGLSRERSLTPHRRHERSQSRGHDDRPRSRSPRDRSRSRSQREDSYDDGRHERTEKWRDREEKRQRGSYNVAPSATVVVKGLSQKTTEEDLYQILVLFCLTSLSAFLLTSVGSKNFLTFLCYQAEWGPLRHIRVIKERNSGISRGFAFIDFPSVEAACAMMDKIGDDGLVVDGRKLFFEYSSKPTGGAGGSFGQDHATKSSNLNHRSITLPSDWMCTICACVNFARRTSCFQCNEPRTDDAPPADIASSNSSTSGKKGFEAGPTHVLVVRGLDENADEEMLRYEFSKHAPIKDLRLVRDKFTHVSRGFAFAHFHSVEDATKALDATNGTTLEKNGQILRVAYAKSILGPGSGASGSSQSSSLAAAAIEAAAFAQQYDAVGWAPKEYHPEEKQSSSGQEQTGGDVGVPNGAAPQSGFVWDEASGYYYDAASGFYYDGNTGLYYDSNSGIWYSYDHQNQQYIPCTEQAENKTSDKPSEHPKLSDASSNKKAVISAPAATTAAAEKAASLQDAIQAAATAALAAEKKEKEKSKEIKLASKSSILANKKKMNNVLSMWKQRSHEGQATRVALDDNQPSGSVDDRFSTVGQSGKNKFKTDVLTMKENAISSSGVDTVSLSAQTFGLESPVKPRPVSNSSGGTLMGVIRGSGRGIVKSDTLYSGSLNEGSISGAAATAAGLSSNEDVSTVTTPFRTDASALGSYASPAVTGSGKRRFSEMPQPSASSHKEPSQTTYRDRAAERRSLYGSSSSFGDDLPGTGFGDSNRDVGKRSALDSMPFPPGVGGGRGAGDVNAQSFEVITADKAIDESNVGNRMLRSMGWHAGLGLGKDGNGMIEPVQAKGMESRAGLGSQQKKLNPDLEVQAGDSYKTLIHKKALARFREMSESS